jgi:hypothetical protein
VEVAGVRPVKDKPVAGAAPVDVQGGHHDAGSRLCAASGADSTVTASNE